jgi:hypothetical protein
MSESDIDPDDELLIEGRPASPDEDEWEDDPEDDVGEPG